jgi:HEAT repeat protein
VTASSTEAPPTAPDEPAERQTTPFLVLQFFIFPMAIVAVCVTVFVVFGLVASDGKSARDYLAEVRTGSANRRWQAAFELSKVLQSSPETALADERFIPEIVSLFEESGDDDPRVRRYLAVALGRLHDRRAVEALTKAVAAGGNDSETLIYSVWALGAIGDARAIPALVPLAQDSDPGVRKAVVHALGGLSSPETTPVLVAALSDSTDDVRWNAALALARHGDPLAKPVLLQMLDRRRLGEVQGLSVEQGEDVLIQAAAAAGRLSDPDLDEALVRLRDSDPSLKVRDAARRALVRPPPTS